MSLLNDLTMQQILARIAGFLIFSGLHGAILAALALALGNRNPAWEGRLTANPFAQVSFAALVTAVLFHAAWVRPMRIDPAHTRGGRLGLVAIVLAGLGLTLLAIPLIDLLRPLAATHLPRTFGYAVLLVLAQTQMIVLVSVVLNLLPLPGLTGGLLLVAAAPDRAQRLRRTEPVAIALLIAVLVAGWWPDATPLMAMVSRLH